MSVLDPSVKNDRNEFKPERWLDAESVKSLKKYQHPFVSSTAFWLNSCAICLADCSVKSQIQVVQSVSMYEASSNA